MAPIFFVKRANETYRAQRHAHKSADPSLGRRFAADGKDLATVIVVAVEQAFQHCPKALVRSNLGQAAAGDRPQGRPELGNFAAARNPAPTVQR